MKQKVSISLDEETIKKVDQSLENVAFRNRSHFIECAITKFLGEDK